jgi:3-oxoacyl-[acyl-carrier protein] reductase
MKLHGSVALVTGASSGLGRALAQALGEAGVDVAVGYRDAREAAEQTCAAIRASGRTSASTAGRRAMPVRLDQTDPASIDAAVAETAKELGRIDILVNCAAWSTDVPFADLAAMTPELWDRIHQTNLRGPFLLARACAPHLKAHGQGRIINVSGGSAFTPSGSSIAQAAAKAALVHLTRCLAVAMAPEVTVNCVAPGLMAGTGMASRVSPEGFEAARQRTALKCTTSIQDVAEQVLAFCRADSVTGQTLVLDGGHVFH